MCNVDEDGERAPVGRGGQGSKGKKCVKCDQQGIVITRIHDSFCKDCFRVYIVHKFRSAIGKSKLIRDGEKVLVAFSGGANSAALLHLISDGLSVRAHKKLRFIPTLLHVDEFSIIGDSELSRLEIQQKISELMVKSGFQGYITSLEQGLCTFDKIETDLKCDNAVEPVIWEASPEISMLQEPSEDDTRKLKEVLTGLSSLTCKEDFLRNLRNQLIISVCRKLGFDKVLTADCSSRLSVRILTDIAQGRGSQLYLDTGFSDSRNGDVMFVRPIRDLTSKEVAMYCNLFYVSSLFLPTLTTKSVPGTSIEHLTESFVTGLQADFPSTTSNIIRTSEKLSQSSEESTIKCSFCKSSLDTNVGSASALNAILFSKMLSKLGQNYKQGETLNSNKEPLGAAADSKMSDVIPHLCFGCRLSLQDFNGDLNSLPFLQKQSSKEENKLDTVRNQISEFLLDDDAV